MSKPWQVWLALAAIFVLGGVCGGFAGYRIARRQFRHQPPPREWVMHRIARIDDELSLTSDEKRRIEPIVQRNVELLTAEWRRSMTQSRGIVEQMEKDIGAQLTPEKQARLEKFLKERRERFRKMMRERGLRGDRPPAEGLPHDGGSAAPPGNAEQHPPSPAPTGT